MIEKFKYLTHRKSFHIVMIITIIAIIFFVVGILILRYNVEGETNMPFELTKISVISSSDGISKETVNTRWNFDLYQYNDIYLYIDKNNDYNGTDTITSVLINNIVVESQNSEKVKIYKPDSEEEHQIFKNEEDNVVQEIVYTGGMESNLKNLEISNQGGIVSFRCSYDNLMEYATDDLEINNQQLLSKAGITNEQLQAKLTFDFTISTQSGKEYQANISLDIPIGDIVGQGTTSQEIIDMSDFIFKRIQN